jgi:hypothetical protein
MQLCQILNKKILLLTNSDWRALFYCPEHQSILLYEKATHKHYLEQLALVVMFFCCNII